MIADYVAMCMYRSGYLVVLAAAIGMIFAWNLILARLYRVGARGIALAAAVAILTAPYLGLTGGVVPSDWW